MEIEDDYSEKVKRKISWKRILGATLIGIPIVFIICGLIEISKVFGPIPPLAGLIGGSMFVIGYLLLKKN